jgi:hypothetical protein
MSVSYGGDSITFADGSVQSGGWTGFKNRIINGGMTISQRSGTSSMSVDGANVVNPDRWTNTEIGNGAFTAQQVTDAPAGFNYSLKVTTTTAQTGTLNALSRQSIEGFNIADLGWGTANAKSITLSFWVKSSLTGSFGGSLRNADGNRCFPFSYTISSANTWEYETITIPGDTTGTWATDNTTGVTLWFSHGTSSTGTAGAWTDSDVRAPAGSVFIIQTLNATWQITGVQLEKGSTASSFEYRPYTTELQLCQRYLPAFTAQSGTVGPLPGSATALGTGGVLIFNHPVSARVPGTGVGFSAATHFNFSNNDGNSPSTAVSFAAGSPDATQLSITVASSRGAATTPGWFYANNTAARLYITGCEL